MTRKNEEEILRASTGRSMMIDKILNRLTEIAITKSHLIKLMLSSRIATDSFSEVL